MDAGEEKLEVFVESVVAAEIGEERTIGRSARIALVPVTVELQAEYQLVGELVLEERTSEGEVAIAVLWDDGFAAASVDGPLVVVEALLEPERKSVPRGADAEAFGGVT